MYDLELSIVLFTVSAFIFGMLFQRALTWNYNRKLRKQELYRRLLGATDKSLPPPAWLKHMATTMTGL